MLAGPRPPGRGVACLERQARCTSWRLKEIRYFRENPAIFFLARVRCFVRSAEIFEDID